ncbi:MAG: hypothetical protein AAF628_07325 [Planctomycetota bacterium]
MTLARRSLAVLGGAALALGASRATAQSCGVGPPTTIGTVSELAVGVPLPGPLPRTTGDALEINCAGIPSAIVGLQVTEPPPGVPVRGTIVFCSGARGGAYYSSETVALPLFQRLTLLGFRLIDRVWPTGWFEDPVGVRRQSCRLATVLHWVRDRYHTTGSFCAMGASGGAAEISYTLTTWGTGDILDVVILTGGPPMARLDYQCPEPPPASWLSMCAAITPQHELTCGQPNCARITRQFGLCTSCTPSLDPTELREDSILHPNAVTDFPNTRIHILIGSGDCLDAVPSAILFFQAVTSEIVMEFVPGAPHFVVLVQEGNDAITRALLGGIACGGPASVAYQSWPSLGTNLQLDVTGPPAGTFLLFGGPNQALVEVAPFGWVFVGGAFAVASGPLDPSNGQASVALPIPSVPSFVGFELFFQGVAGTCLTNLARLKIVP